MTNTQTPNQIANGLLNHIVRDNGLVTFTLESETNNGSMKLTIRRSQKNPTAEFNLGIDENPYVTTITWEQAKEMIIKNVIK